MVTMKITIELNETAQGHIDTVLTVEGIKTATRKEQAYAMALRHAFLQILPQIGKALGASDAIISHGNPANS